MTDRALIARAAEKAFAFAYGATVGFAFGLAVCRVLDPPAWVLMPVALVALLSLLVVRDKVRDEAQRLRGRA